MLRTLLVPAILVGIIATPLLVPLGKQPRVSSAPQLPVSQPACILILSKIKPHYLPQVGHEPQVSQTFSV